MSASFNDPHPLGRPVLPSAVVLVAATLALVAACSDGVEIPAECFPLADSPAE